MSETVLPLYKSYAGRLTYDKTLKLCSLKFPQYVDELKGMADGAKVPFFKVSFTTDYNEFWYALKVPRILFVNWIQCITDFSLTH